MTFWTIEERNADIMKAMEEYDLAIGGSPERARAALLRMEDIYYPDGRIRPEYGGEAEVEPDRAKPKA